MTDRKNMLNLSALRRRLIGGIWIKNKEESCYRYCVYSSVSNDWLSHFDTEKQTYSSFGDTNVGIELIENHGDIKWLGRLRGYNATSARVYRRNIVGSMLDKLGMEVGLVMFGGGIILLVQSPLVTQTIVSLCQ
jgi:hypothetical protein